MKLKLKTLVDKYKSLSAPVKASIWFTACNIIQKGIALISTPIFTRIMTTQQYGVYTIYQSWYQVLTIFATLNLSAGIFNNGLTKYPEKKSEFVSSLQGLSTTVTFVLFLIYIAIPQFWNELLGLGTLFVVAMFVQLLFEPAYLFWSAEQRYQYNYKSLIFTTMIIAIGSPLRLAFYHLFLYKLYWVYIFIFERLQRESVFLIAFFGSMHYRLIFR